MTDATRPAATEDRERFARRELDGRSILFQPISGRWFLFFVLLGTAVTLAFLRMESSRPSMGHPDLPEALVISVMGGLGTAVWGLVFIAVVRFVWANLYGYVPWVAKSPLTDGILDPADPKRNAISRLRPESLAVLAAIITMLFSFNPLIAAIVAVIVWNVSRSRSAKRELDGGTNPAYSASPVETMPKSNLLEKGFSSLSDLWRAGRDRIRPVFAFAGRLFGPTSTERNRLLLAIGWFVVGGIDLCFLLVFISILASHHTGNSSALFVMSLFGLVFSLISFAVSFCIQSRQNPSIVQSMSYVGLLPLSLGAIGRLPLGIATLFWLNAPGTRDSFEATPWAQTKLGGLLRHTLSFGRRSLGTTVWLMLWAIAWPLVVVAVVIFWVIPYGPSTYEIYDKSIVTLKGVPNKRFELIASGTGDIVGLSPPVQSYRCQQLGLGSVGGVRESQLTVPLPEYPASEKAMEDLTREIARGLYRLFNESYPKHAASLAQASQRLNVAERLGDTPMGDNRFQQKSLMERLRGFENSNRPVSTPWKGAVRFGSILDPELFQVELDTNFSHFDSHPSTILMVSGGIAAFLIWLVVSLWIIKRRHFSRIATKPAVVAVAT